MLLTDTRVLGVGHERKPATEERDGETEAGLGERRRRKWRRRGNSAREEGTTTELTSS